MDREKAFELVKKHLKNKNLIKHCLAVEAIMKGIAKELNTDFHSRFNRHFLGCPNYPQRTVPEPGNLHFPVKFFNA